MVTDAAAEGGGIRNAGTLTVTNSTLSGNSADGGSNSAGRGGGIYNAGTLTVTSSTLSGNSVNGNVNFNSYGGGIWNASALTLADTVFQGNKANGGGGLDNGSTGTATVQGCTFSGNSTLAVENGGSSASGGGAISNAGTMTLTDSTVTGNLADFSYPAVAYGGGVLNNGTLTVSRSTFSGNMAAGAQVLAEYGSGGAIDNNGQLVINASTFSGNVVGAGSGGAIMDLRQLAINNSTFSGNVAGAHGQLGAGGAIIIIYEFSASLTLTNVTISGNTAGYYGGGLTVNSGGGLVPTTNLRNTLIAGNSATLGPDEFGDLTTAFNILIGKDDGSSGLVNGQNGNQVGTSAHPIDPKLGPLENNGGPTQTMALLPGSPALDAGDNAYSPGATDQRGLPRIVNGTIDIGAYEAQASQAKPLFALGGAPGRVQVHRVTDDAIVADFAPYGAAYTDLVNVAVGDVNGDGIDDVITATAAGNPDVRVYDGRAFADGTFNPDNPNAGLIAQWFPYGLNFNVGATVAVGDIEHNGFADIVTGADVGNPDVRVYRGKDIANKTFDSSGASLIVQWFPYGLNFNVGANVAVGDVTGDGFADVVTGTTAGNPDVRVYNGKDIAQGTFNPVGRSLLAQLFPYALQFNVGAFVAVGDTTGSGFGDVITGASIGNPDVRVYSGKAIAQGTFDNANPDASLRDQFFAYGLNYNIGVAVASADFESNGKFDILTGAAAGTPHYRVVKGNATVVEPPALFQGIVPDMQGGLAVGA
jgi:hypothetical protein